MIAEILKEDFIATEATSEKFPIRLLRTDLGCAEDDDLDLFSVEGNRVESSCNDSF